MSIDVPDVTADIHLPQDKLATGRGREGECAQRRQVVLIAKWAHQIKCDGWPRSTWVVDRHEQVTNRRRDPAREVIDDDRDHWIAGVRNGKAQIPHARGNLCAGHSHRVRVMRDREWARLPDRQPAREQKGE